MGDRELLLVTSVDIGEGRTASISVYQGDQAQARFMAPGQVPEKSQVCWLSPGALAGGGGEVLQRVQPAALGRRTPRGPPQAAPARAGAPQRPELLASVQQRLTPEYVASGPAGRQAQGSSSRRACTDVSTAQCAPALDLAGLYVNSLLTCAPAESHKGSRPGSASTTREDVHKRLYAMALEQAAKAEQRRREK